MLGGQYPRHQPGRRDKHVKGLAVLRTPVLSLAAGLASVVILVIACGGPGDETTVRGLLNREVNLIEKRDWRGLYELYSSDFQSRCPYDEFLDLANSQLTLAGEFQIGYDGLEVTVDGDRAFATYILTVDGVDVQAVTEDDPDWFIKEGGRWRDDYDEHTRCGGSSRVESVDFSVTTPMTSPTLAPSLPRLRPDPARLQEAEVLGVINGDTIDVRIDGRMERVRYYGVATPERGERCFDEATARNEALVGEAVLLLPDARERDPFDRLLRYVFTDGAVSVEARLIAEGLGVAWREDGAFRDELVALEEKARAAQAGCLWE